MQVFGFQCVFSQGKRFLPSFHPHVKEHLTESNEENEGQGEYGGYLHCFFDRINGIFRIIFTEGNEENEGVKKQPRWGGRSGMGTVIRKGQWGTLVLLLLYLTISLKSEYLSMAFLPRTEQRPAFSRLIDKARLTSEVLYPKSLTAKWQIMPLASLTCLFRLAEMSDASFRSRWNATAFINCSNGIFFFLTFSQSSPAHVMGDVVTF